MLESTEMKIINSAEMYDMRKLQKSFCDHTGSGWSRSNDNCHAYEQLRGKSEQRIRLVEIERVSYEMCKVWS